MELGCAPHAFSCQGWGGISSHHLGCSLPVVEGRSSGGQWKPTLPQKASAGNWPSVTSSHKVHSKPKVNGVGCALHPLGSHDKGRVKVNNFEQVVQSLIAIDSIRDPAGESARTTALHFWRGGNTGRIKFTGQGDLQPRQSSSCASRPVQQKNPVGNYKPLSSGLSLATTS